MRRCLMLGALLAAVACNDRQQVACTEEFRTATVTIVDGGAQLVPDATVQTHLVRTGELVPVTSLMDLAPGHYVILDDNATGLIQGDGEQFRVTASRSDDPPVQELYAFSAPNGCHIEKVSGPDTLVMP